MTIFFHRGRQLAAMLAASALLGMLPVSLRAGEPIQFSNGKVIPKAKPGNSLTRGIETGPDEGTGVEGLDLVMPMFGLPSIDSKEEKRRKEAQLERQNWMILDQGELQEQREDEERFGIRSDRIEKDKAPGDYWFSPDSDARGRPGSGRGTSTSRTRMPGQSRALPPGANRAQDAAVVRSSPAVSEAKTSEPQGAHISNVLNPRNLFGPDHSGGSGAGENSTLSFKDLFGGSGGNDSGRSSPSPLKGLGNIESRSSLSLDNRLDVRPPASLPAFAPASSGIFDGPSRSAAGGSAFDQGAGGAGYWSRGSFGSAAASESFSARGSTFDNNYPASQSAASSRARTSREFFDRPKMVGQ